MYVFIHICSNIYELYIYVNQNTDHTEEVVNKEGKN